MSQPHSSSSKPLTQDQLFRLMIENVNDYAIFMTNLDGAVVVWNEGAQRILGWTEQEIVGKSAEILFTEHDCAHKEPEKEMTTALRTGHARDERWHVRKDGSLFFAFGMMTRVNDNAGKPVGFTKILRDMTQQKQLELRLRIEHDIAMVFADGRSVHEALPRALEAIGSQADWDWGAIWKLTPDGHSLRSIAQWHPALVAGPEFEELTRRLELDRGVGLPGRVLATHEAAWVSDLSEEKNFPRKAAAAQAGLRAAICFPVLFGSEVVAILEFFSRQLKPPDEQMLLLMKIVGAQLGQFLHRREVEEALLQSRVQQSAVMAAALDCVVMMDHQGRVLEWNPAAEATFGYKREEILGNEMAQFIIPESLREQHRKGLARYLAGGEAVVLGTRIEISALRKSGSEFPVELTITKVPSGGPPVFVGFLRDITQRVHAERERKMLLDLEQASRHQAETALAEAQRANRLKDQFIASVSHELRTPLAPVLLTIDMLQQATLAEPVRQDLEMIKRNVELEVRLINDLIDVSRVASKKLVIAPEPVSLHQIIERALQISAEGMTGKKIHSRVEFAAGDDRVRGDPDRLQQVFWNLLSNAVKFAPAGGEVSITTQLTDHNTIQATVSDNGMGIPNEALTRIFEPFEQVEGTTRTQQGMGLGLSICKGIIEAHGGRISATSAGAGLGSCFTVELPRP